LNNYEIKEMTKINGLLSRINEPTLSKMEKEALITNSKMVIGDKIPQFMGVGDFMGQ